MFLVLQARAFSESEPQRWTAETVKDWLYTVTPDELVSELVDLKNLERETPMVTFPLNSFFLTEKGTLISRWDTPMVLKIGRLEYRITMDQIEVPEFYKAPRPKVPWAWIGAGVATSFAAGLLIGIMN